MKYRVVWVLLVFIWSCSDDDGPVIPDNLVAAVTHDDWSSTYRYNGNGQLISQITESSFTEEKTFIYDGRGRVVNITTTIQRDGDFVSETACGYVWDEDYLESVPCAFSPSQLFWTDEYEWNETRTSVTESREGRDGSTTYTLEEGNVVAVSSIVENDGIPRYELAATYEYTNSPTFNVPFQDLDNFIATQVNAHPSRLLRTETLDINTDLQVVLTWEATFEFTYDDSERVSQIVGSWTTQRFENGVLITEDDYTKTTDITYRS